MLPVNEDVEQDEYIQYEGNCRTLHNELCLISLQKRTISTYQHK